MKPTRNLLVLFEELGGDISKISLVKRTAASICAHTFEHHPAVANYRTENTGETKMLHQANVHLRCEPGQSISIIKFASYGTPSGTCGTFHQGTCHAWNSRAIIEKASLHNLSQLARDSIKKEIKVQFFLFIIESNLI